jgi:YVTN family beta-propeller protein
MSKRALILIVLAAALAATIPSNGANLITSVATDQGPAAFAVDPTSGVVYVGNVTDGTVAVLAGAVAVTKLKVDNPAGLAVDSVGNKLYVASFDKRSVFVYSTLTFSRLAEVKVDGHPWGIDVDQATGRVFVANFESNTLQVLQRDAATVSTVALPGCAGPVGVAWNAATSRAFVTCIYSGTIAVVSNNLTTMEGIDLGLGTYPWGIASHPTGNEIYVGSWEGGGAAAGAISVIDADTRAVLASAHIGGAPIGLAVSRGGTPYVALSALNSLGILNPSTGVIEESLVLPTDPKDGLNEPHAVAVSPTGALVYVGNYHGESVSVVNALPRD